MRRRWTAMIASAAAVSVAGCSSKAPAPVRAVSSPPRSTFAVSPETYVAQAASIDLFVIRSSELAQLRSATPQVRRFSDQMIAAHKGTSAQLSFAGRRLNLLPGSTLLPQHQAMFDELAASTSFEPTYLRLMRSVHGAAYALHSGYAARGASPTLRPVASSAAAIERSHLDMLRRL